MKVKTIFRKIIFLGFLFCLASANISALTKLALENGVTLVFEGCEDGSVRFESLGTGGRAKAPAKEFELKRKASNSDFVKNDSGAYDWNGYSIVINANGYELSYNEKLIYSSTFSEDKKLLREIRTWNTATEFYGFGEASRKVSLRNQSFTIYNESKYGDHAYVFIPFYVTNEGTSVFYNANGRDKIYFQDGEDAQVYRSEYFRIENYVRQDSNPMEGVQKFYAETETSCMMPRWAYGYIQSKYGYKSAQEVIDLADDFKKHDIPLSAVVLDLYWFKKMGDIYWTSDSFADYKKMDERLEQDGIKLITITEPFFTDQCANFSELKSAGLLCKDSKGKIKLWHDWWCLDDKLSGIFNPLGKKASDFMGKKYSQMLDSGIEGFWTDLGEPEKVPEDLKYGKYAEQDFHNYYNFYWSKALFEGVHKIKPDHRLFIMSRSAGTGSGKFNVSVWSGDVSVSWPALGNQIAYGINAGLSGLPYWGSDVGGFVQNVSPAELYVRWQQFGAFTPIHRAHGTGPREPYAYPDKEREIVTNFIRIRTRLLPYIYSTARQTMSGIPMMRPMFYEDAATPVNYIETQYMFGDSILVAPVTKEASATTERTLYLPKGIWYDFFTHEKVNAGNGKEITVKTSLEKIPVYVKEGAIIPEQKNDELSVLVFPSESGKESSFVFYNDDGVTEKYKNGEFAEVQFVLKGRNLKASVNGKAEFIPAKLTIELPNGSKKTVGIEELEKGIEL